MFQRCCCNACSVSYEPVPVFENITMVVGFPESAGDSSQPPIAPYARGWYVFQSGSCILERPAPNETCGLNDGTMGVCYDMSFDGTELSANWLTEPAGVVACAAGEGETVDVVGQNCYRATGEVYDFSHPCLPGWKGVTAESHWPGRFGFINGAGECCYPAWDAGIEYPVGALVSRSGNTYISLQSGNLGLDPLSYPSSWYNGGAFVGSQSTPQTKYSTVEATIKFDNDETYSEDGTLLEEFNQHADWYQIATADDYGNISRSGRRHWYGREYYNYGSPTENIYDGCDDIIDSGYRDGRYDVEFVAAPPSLFAGSITRWHVALTTVTVKCGIISMIVDGDSFAGTIAEFETYWDNIVQGTVDAKVALEGGSASGTVTASLSDDELLLDIEYNATRTISTIVQEVASIVKFSIKLSGSITYASVMDDAIALLDEWPLNDDRVYPWRTDAQVWLQPLVQRDAAATEPTINWNVDENCDFTQDNYYSGRIIGSPLPAGYKDHFDFNHVNWMRNSSGGLCIPCEDSLGDSSASPLPQTVTRWTDYSQGSTIPGAGAHVQQIIDYNYSSNSPGPSPVNGVRMTKWAETLAQWPSIRFARPCGSDRWRMDMTNASCITAEDTGTKTLTLDTDFSASISAGNLVVIYGGGSYASQIWSVASYTHPSLILDTQLDVPEAFVAEVVTEWAGANGGTADQWGTYGVVGKLRWQASNLPAPRAICRRENVTAVYSAPDSTVTVGSATSLITGDKVDFLDAAGTSIGGLTDLTWTRLTDTTGTVAADVTAAVFVRTSNTSIPAALEWDKDTSANTFIRSEFLSDYPNADYDVTEDQWDIAPSTSPTVLCVSPNADDVFDHGMSWSWDSTVIEADMCYGVEWHMLFTQAINDPFWQAPRSACSGAIAQDSSPCAGAADAYKFPPLVEPLLVAPVGSPTLPADVTLWTELIMPTAVGTVTCEDIPRSSPHVLTYRSAWEACDEWKPMTQKT